MRSTRGLWIGHRRLVGRLSRKAAGPRLSLALDPQQCCWLDGLNQLRDILRGEDMRLIIILATLTVAACSQSLPQHQKQTRFILRCDGEATEGSGNDQRRYPHQNTFRFDLAAGTMEYWNAEERRWNQPLPGVRGALEVSPTSLTYRSSFGDQFNGSESLYRFDRIIGTLSRRGRSFASASDLGPALDYPDTFEARCVGIESPSTGPAF